MNIKFLVPLFVLTVSCASPNRKPAQELCSELGTTISGLEITEDHRQQHEIEFNNGSAYNAKIPMLPTLVANNGKDLPMFLVNVAGGDCTSPLTAGGKCSFVLTLDPSVKKSGVASVELRIQYSVDGVQCLHPFPIVFKNPSPDGSSVQKAVTPTGR